MSILYLVWRQPGQRWWPVGRLTRHAEFYVFEYTHGARLAEEAGFHPLIGFDEWDKVYFSAALFPLFDNRLFPKNRSEYAKMPRWAGLDLTNPDPDPLVVLGRTLGPRVTDMFEVFAHPEPDAAGDYVTTFFAHGLAHRSAEERGHVLTLNPDEPLRLEPDPDNPADVEAVRLVTQGGVHVGFVPRYLCRDVRELTATCPRPPHARVRHVNTDAPPQFLLLCTIRACWPESFHPCSGEEYRPVNPRTREILAEVDEMLASRRAHAANG